MIIYERQVQCSACLFWRPWVAAFDRCPRCHLRIGARDRYILSPLGSTPGSVGLGVPEEALAHVRDSFRIHVIHFLESNRMNRA
jgi:hypothetical protein